MSPALYLLPMYPPAEVAYRLTRVLAEQGGAEAGGTKVQGALLSYRRQVKTVI